MRVPCCLLEQPSFTYTPFCPKSCTERCNNHTFAKNFIKFSSLSAFFQCFPENLWGNRLSLIRFYFNCCLLQLIQSFCFGENIKFQLFFSVTVSRKIRALFSPGFADFVLVIKTARPASSVAQKSRNDSFNSGSEKIGIFSSFSRS